MKLGEAVDTSGLGYLEVKEREGLRGNAAKVRAGMATRLAKTANIEVVAADRVLEAVKAEPWAYGLGFEEPPEVKPAASTPQRTADVLTHLDHLLLAFESVSRLEPRAAEAAKLVATARADIIKLKED